VLDGAGARLRPLRAEDTPALREIAFEAEIWKYFVFRIDSERALDQFVEDALRDMREGKRAVFAVIDKRNERLAGSMAYGNLAPAEGRLEVGWSWLGAAFRGSGVNAWAKFLLLEFAFESLRCERVEFKTDVLNARARRGLQGIGAREEGVLRSYNWMPDGRRRDAIYYSVLRSEWPDVRGLLRSRLGGGAAA
jgi:RimJ/RimL family protein N-acetyltransferase